MSNVRKLLLINITFSKWKQQKKEAVKKEVIKEAQARALVQAHLLQVQKKRSVKEKDGKNTENGTKNSNSKTKNKDFSSLPKKCLWNSEEPPNNTKSLLQKDQIKHSGKSSENTVLKIKWNAKNRKEEEEEARVQVHQALLQVPKKRSNIQNTKKVMVTDITSIIAVSTVNHLRVQHQRKRRVVVKIRKNIWKGSLIKCLSDLEENQKITNNSFNKDQIEDFGE